MKKIEAILKGKQGDLAPIKEKKIRMSLEVALLNAVDDLQTKELEYEFKMCKFDYSSDCYTDILDNLVCIKKDIIDIEQWIVVLKQVQADLDAEVKEDM